MLVSKRHRLSKREQLRGVRKGIHVLKRKRGGPRWLIPSMEKFAKRLAAEIRGR